jgi:hypothetical protein
MPMAAGANTPAQEQRDPARIRPCGQLRAVTTESDMSQERVRFGHHRQVLVEHRPIPHPGRQPHRKRPHPDLLSQQASVPLPATSTTAREICCRTGPCRRSTQRHTTGQLIPEKVGGCCKGDSNPGPTHCQSAVPQDPMTPAELQTSLVRRTIRHMATYAYRCAEHGDFDISRPMGMAAATSRCKICNKEAVRVFCAPMLSFAPRALVAAIDRTVKSRDEPEVVSALPPRPVRAHNSTATSNPAWRRLPRP